jgi:hypothetical protein
MAETEFGFHLVACRAVRPSLVQGADHESAVALLLRHSVGSDRLRVAAVSVLANVFCVRVQLKTPWCKAGLGETAELLA